MVPIRLTNGHQMAAEHAAHVLSFYNNYYRGKDLTKINSWLKTNCSATTDFESILTAKPQALKDLAEQYINLGQPVLNEAIIRIKTVYSYFRTYNWRFRRL